MVSFCETQGCVRRQTHQVGQPEVKKKLERMINLTLTFGGKGDSKGKKNK